MVVRKVINVTKEKEVNEKIVAIGDIHGDYDATIEILKKCNLIDKKNNWCGGKTRLIQIGDIMDRGGRDDMYGDEDSEVKIINFFYKLKKQSNKKGGDVVCLIGNHELMNFQGIFDYCSDLTMKNFGSSKNRKKFYKPGNKMCLLMNKLFKVIEQIGPWIFVHGGIRSYLSKKYSIDDINEVMYQYLAGDIKLEKTKKFKELFMDDSSLLWYRGFSHDSINSRLLTNSLNNMNAKYMVVGHTIQDRINARCKNKIWRIDTGMSHAFGKRTHNDSRVSCIEIIDNGRKVNIIY